MIADLDESFQTYDGAYGPHEPIAIVGLAIRLPGQVSNAQDLWKLMMEKKSGLVDVPRQRWNIDGFHSQVPKPGSVQNRQAYYLDHIDLEKFDASCFSFSPQEIERLDPMQRQLLEITRECLENAGEVGWRNKDIGCYVGQFSGDWLEENAMDPHTSGLYRGTGFADFFLPNRVSYEYGWTGPSMTIKTGCSASMVAVHQAAEALRNRSCSAAIALSANLMTSPLTTVIYTEAGILSKTGKCKTFDSSADGYGRGEAVNAVLVKRLSDAIRDGNPVRAILRGSATNHDGREGKSGMLNPNTHTHEALIRKAYKDAGIEDFSRTAFFECHGTGTPAGDPQEVAAVSRVFGESGMIIGALKPNVGHAEGAAGLSSIIKAILALEKETIPPNIYFKNPNPRIPWKAAKLVVPKDPISWPKDRAKRVSVNSFGVGGSNAHVILESYIELDEGCHVKSAKITGPRLVLFSAGNEKSLSMQVERHREYLAANPSSLEDMAYTLGRRREHFPCRTFALVDERNEFEVSISQAHQRVASRTVFVFTGQGAQSPGMGRRLIKTNDVFRTTIRDLDAHLQSLLDAPSWSLEDELSRREDSRVMGSEFSIPCSTAMQLALVDVLRSMDVHPKAVIGHSSGEIAAAYAAHIFTAKEAIILAYYRGRALQDRSELGPGAMAVVGLSPEAVRPFLIPGAVVACENSQTNTTISGDKLAVEASLEQIRKTHADVLVRLLRVESAFHSHHMKPYGPAFESLIRPHLSPQPSKIPFFSTVTGDLAVDGFGPEYWHQSFVEPVLFHSALQNLVKKHNNNLFLEIGPHPALQGPINQTMRSFPTARAEYVATLCRNEDSTTSLTRLAGNLFIRHVSFDAAVIIPQGRVLTDLPTYAWLHETTYIDAPRNAARYKHRKFPRHDLLGARVLEGNDIEPAWRNMLELKDVYWLADHVVLNKTVFPGAGFIAIAGEAIRQISGEQNNGYTIRDLSISAPLMLTTEKRTEVYTRLIPTSGTEEDRKWYEFKVMSFDGTQWASHCTGLIASAPQEIDDWDAAVSQPLPRQVPTDEWYQTTKRVGYDWRLAFQGLDDITAGTVQHEAAATIYNFDDSSHYAAHPTVLDQCFQIALVAKTRGLRRNCTTLALPTSIDRIDVCGDLETHMRIYSTAANAKEPEKGA
ncbi:hypothetical protein EKO04_003961 [Ascochyta lentis]|uniref:Polyketide synthase n=1 Tax=Ascochyta lentis TaxID=205686 RepID=A0A8H7J7D2_9PLEO|nr:hypothetical protein EKO04_003961 [Ascochyta lentis]